MTTDGDDFDALLSILGYGRWQVPGVVVTLLVASQIPAQLVGSPLLCGPVPFRCSRETPEVVTRLNSSTYFSNECFSPTSLPSDAITQPSNSTDLFLSNGTRPQRTGMESCPVIEYDTSIFTSTIISEFHLVCERESLQPLFQMMYTVGIIFGSLFGGYIGDKWGRRRAVQGGVVVYVAVVLAMAFVPSFVFVLVMRVMVGVTHQCMLIPVWSLALESTPTRHRSLVGMLLGLPYSLFVIVLAGVGYFVRTWKYLMLVCCAPALALLPLSFIMDESARWLIQQKRREEARKVLRKAVRQNKAKLPVPLETIIGNLDQRECVAEDNQSAARKALKEAWEYLRSPAMRTIILVTPILWFLQSCLYLAVAINANNFNSSNPFLYVCLSGAMDASAILLVTPLTTRLGRRVIVGAGLFVGGIFFLLDLLVPIGYFWAKWILVMAGFLLVAGSFQMNYVYGPELFPTEARTRGFAFISLIGGMGSMIAPIITYKLALLTWWAAPVTFGCAGLLGSLTLPLLPETRNQPMPDTLKDVDDRRLRRKIKSANLGKENQAYENTNDI
ncbi:organic cation transporter protein-like isoform X2 [Penaeus monodon]|uniref:organic cation transporter protein-like isoform X2 n=1 Tax=Penaeus monodon TaxID=6687 RepID=UPI0018A7D69D|nr:organic cation transporter protein-like isoform X2 [Penaeus monodon]